MDAWTKELVISRDVLFEENIVAPYIQNHLMMGADSVESIPVLDLIQCW